MNHIIKFSRGHTGYLSFNGFASLVRIPIRQVFLLFVLRLCSLQAEGKTRTRMKVVNPNATPNKQPTVIPKITGARGGFGREGRMKLCTLTERIWFKHS